MEPKIICRVERVKVRDSALSLAGEWIKVENPAVGGVKGYIFPKIIKFTKANKRGDLNEF